MTETIENPGAMKPMDKTVLSSQDGRELPEEVNQPNSELASSQYVDDIVLEVLRKSQLEDYNDAFIFLFNVRRFDQFSHVLDKNMQDIGIQQPQIETLREQILQMSREIPDRSDQKQVYVGEDQWSHNRSAEKRKSALFTDKVDQEANDAEALTLANGDEVIFVGNTGQNGTGHNSKNHLLDSNSRTLAVTPSAVTPKKALTREEQEEVYWRIFINFGRDENETTTPEEQQVPKYSTSELHSRSSSIVNGPSEPQQPVQILCLMPTPEFDLPGKLTNNQQNTVKKPLIDELEGNSSPAQMSGGNASMEVLKTTQNEARVPLSQPALQPQNVQQPVMSQLRGIQKPIQQQPVQARPAQIQPQQVKLPPPSATTAPTTTTTASASQGTRPLAPPATESRKVSEPALIAPTTTTAPTSTSSVVTRRPNQTITMSEEERRSRTVQDIPSALPAPGAPLFGSNSTSALPSTTTQAVVKDRLVAAQVKPYQPQPTMPPKKTSEPILSTEVLQPTRVVSAVSAAKLVSQPVPTPQPVQNPSPPLVQTGLVDKKPAIPLAQSTNVPLFNITNLSLYHLNSFLNHGSFYQPYAYGIKHKLGHSGNQRYTPYPSGMGQSAPTNQTLAPLLPSESRFSGSAQPLDQSAVNKVPGAQNRQKQFRVNLAKTASVLCSSAPSSACNNLSARAPCDIILDRAKTDTKLRNNLIDLLRSHLLAMPVTSNARKEIQERQETLEAAIRYFGDKIE